MIHFLNDERPQPVRSKLADLLFDLPPGRRGGVLLMAVSFRPSECLEGSFRVGPVRAAFAECWEFQFGEPVPSKALRKAFDLPTPIGVLLEFNKLALGRDMSELEQLIADLVLSLRKRVESVEPPMPIASFDLRRQQSTIAEQGSCAGGFADAANGSMLKSSEINRPERGIPMIQTKTGIATQKAASDVSSKVVAAEISWANAGEKNIFDAYASLLREQARLNKQLATIEAKLQKACQTRHLRELRQLAPGDPVEITMLDALPATMRKKLRSTGVDNPAARVLSHGKAACTLDVGVGSCSVSYDCLVTPNGLLPSSKFFDLKRKLQAEASRAVRGR